MEEGLDVRELLWFQDEGHGGHGGDAEDFEAFGEDFVRLEEALLDVLGFGAGGDAIKGGADGAALAFEGVAEDAGGGGMLVENLLAARGVAGERSVVGLIEAADQL